MSELNKQIVSFTSLFSCSAYIFYKSFLSKCNLSSWITRTVFNASCALSFITSIFPQGPHMVTEELHSISFETQVCLYGLTINLEVSIQDRLSGVGVKGIFQQFVEVQECWATPQVCLPSVRLSALTTRFPELLEKKSMLWEEREAEKTKAQHSTNTFLSSTYTQHSLSPPDQLLACGDDFQCQPAAQRVGLDYLVQSVNQWSSGRSSACKYQLPAFAHLYYLVTKYIKYKKRRISLLSWPYFCHVHCYRHRTLLLFSLSLFPCPDIKTTCTLSFSSCSLK